MKEKQRGVLLNVSSLWGGYGIGSMGKSAFAFVDFLAQCGFSLWQVLPLCPTSYGDSPYQSPSAFAGNPYFIDLDLLVEDGLLNSGDLTACGETAHAADEYVDYASLYGRRYKTLRLAYSRFCALKPKDYAAFIAGQADWLNDYALFMALKTSEQMRPWPTWPKQKRVYKTARARYGAGGEKEQEVARETDFWRFTQYEFFRQWGRVKAAANEKKIQIIGDMPIYVAYDSVDVWSAPELFQLKKDFTPKRVAGVPPDMFSATGQLWGNPLYRYEVMQEDDFAWWSRRIKAAMRLYDRVRIDHFRGFSAYYGVPFGDETAENGKWYRGPGYKLFQTIGRSVPEAKILAEDLGLIDERTQRLLKKCGFPGMKVYQFGCGEGRDHPYLPENYPENCIAYTGTHDNDTTVGWFCSLSPEAQSHVMWLFNLENGQFGQAAQADSPADNLGNPAAREEDGLKNTAAFVNNEMLSRLFASKAKYALAPMQDLMGFGSFARMNTPSTPSGNWRWRLLLPPGEPVAAAAKNLTDLSRGGE